ncbi:MAG: stage III sporulation protein AE [Clostridia bacterium]|nr:stage III sporulation protein AE [Clostridia bacterium]
MKKIILVFILVLLLLPSKVYAETEEEIMSSTQEKFNISGFIKQAEEYIGESFGEFDLENMLNQAVKGKIDNKSLYKKVFKILGQEISSSIKILISVLVIIVIHGILKSITDNLENNSISQIIYFVQYILIVTLIMSNFTEIIQIVKETASDLVGFINVLIPLLLTLMIYTGNIATSTLIQPIILFISNFIGNIIADVLIPIVLIIVVFSIISKISERVQVDKISKFLKSSVVWFLGIVLTIFVGVVSLEGTLSSSVDGVTAKTAKAAVSTVIPVVGKVLGDVVDSVLGCGVILKNAVGIIGVIVIVGICIMPIIKIGTLSIVYSLASAVIQPIADEKVVKLLDEMGGIFKLLLAILCSLSVLLIIGATMVVKISNSGMMYR